MARLALILGFSCVLMMCKARGGGYYREDSHPSGQGYYEEPYYPSGQGYYKETYSRNTFIKNLAFSAQVSTDQIAVPVGSTIVFDQVNVESPAGASGYDPATGVFTSPQNCVYAFSASIFEGIGGSFTGTLAVMRTSSGNPSPTLVIATTFSQESSSTTALVDLKEGDTLFVETAEDDNINIRALGTTFSAWCLFES